jgi:hypothetical protein
MVIPAFSEIKKRIWLRAVELLVEGKTITTLQ